MWASLESSSPHTVSQDYTNTAKNQEAAIKSNLMEKIDSFKKDINKSQKKNIQENSSKQVGNLTKE